MFLDIEESINWEAEEFLSKGWSNDKKYKIRTKDGKLLLLRLSDISQYEAKKKEYEIISKYSKTGIDMSMPMGLRVRTFS